MEFEAPQIDARLVTRLVVAVILIMLIWIGFKSVRFQNIKPEQVAVIMNNLTGKPTLRNRAGAVAYCPYFQDIYILDKTVQTMEMTKQEGVGDRSGKDDVKIKTVDGSDVDVDITINYEIDADKAVEILKSSGPEDAVKEKWIRDYARSICRNKFGALITEEFYDSEQRRLKAIAAQEELNRKLNPFGIRVSSVIPQDFSFYEEFQAKIMERKLADQEIEEQRSLGKAAEERQKKVEIEETKKMEVDVARFQGEMEKQRIEAEAERDRVMREADAYAIKIMAEADAEFIKLQNEAKGILATRKAEAEGIKALAQALEGPGGVNLVRMEYARKLTDLQFTGTPISVVSEMEKLELRDEGAAARSSRPPARNRPAPANRPAPR